MNQSRNPISAVIITHNVAGTIRPCLVALKKVCTEIIVVDSFSDDGTADICLEEGAKLVSHEWLGFSGTKNLGNKLAANDWILSIDSDEVLSEELIRALKEVNLAEGCVYALDRITNYCGKWIYHSGWYPEWKVRLFNRKHALWKGDFVHETLFFPDNFMQKKLKGKLFHYSYSDASDHIKRIEKYAKLSAQERFENGKKTSFVQIWFSPIARFIRTYFLKKGFLDGKEGLLISWRSAQMVNLRYRILKELWKNKIA
ncbi:MAG: glycosyltransferase family 2 protein [Bacteroidota bacterium]